MSQLDELRKKLESGDWKERRDAVEELAQMTSQHSQVIYILKEQLEKEKDDDVLKACVSALKKLNALDDDVLSILKERMLKEKEDIVIGNLIEAFAEIGIKDDEIAHILSKNPNIDLSWHVWHDRKVAQRVILKLLHNYWWSLSPEVRNSLSWLSERWWEHHHWVHCPECHYLWHELFDNIRSRKYGEAEWLIHSLASHLGEPRWTFSRYDFEGLMGVKTEDWVYYEELNILRFRFLETFATDRKGKPLREWTKQWEWDEIVETEDRFDKVRDEISDLRHKQDNILREAKRRREGRPLEPGEHLPQDLQVQWDEIVERLQQLEGDVEPGELNRLRKKLEEATDQIFPTLRERGVEFPIEVEGVLGEYNFYNRKITFYLPMIKLAAQNLSSKLKRNENEVFNHLYTIVEMHETAHALTHLGIDTDGNHWENPEQGSPNLHEFLAQLYTWLLIKCLRDHQLEEIFLKLNEQQPERYRYWQILRDLSPEKIRDFFIKQRKGQITTADILIDQILNEIATINKADELIKFVLSDMQVQSFINKLKNAQKEVNQAKTRWELALAIEELMKSFEIHPFISSLIRYTFSPALLSNDDKKLLLAGLLVEGSPIGKSSLRLTTEQIKNAMGTVLTQNDLIRKNKIIRQLESIEESKFLVQKTKENIPKPNQNNTRTNEEII